MPLFNRVLALLTVLLANIAYASDWQYTGSNKEGSYIFFDTESLTHPTKDVTRVWVKSIHEHRFDSYYKSHEKLVIEKSARKLASGYFPRFLDLQVIKSKYETAELEDSSVALTGYEVMANEPDIQTFTKFFFEIDCENKRIKLLDGVIYKDNGNISSSKARPNSDYNFIMPDSTGQWLSLLVCPRN